VIGGISRWSGRFLLWIFLAQAAYSVYVGGDAWEYWGGSNRYLAIAMPGMFVLMSYGVYLLTPTLVDAAAGQASSASRKRFETAAFAGMIGFAAVALNAIHGTDALREWLLVKPPLHSGSGDENARDVTQALMLRQVTTVDATVALVRAGTIPYFLDRFSIDLLGKTDRQIAREQARLPEGLSRFIAFRPGHVKYDYAYSLGELRPDVIVELWEHPKDAKPYVSSEYARLQLFGTCMYFRRESRHIRWNELTAPACSS
jgi:hypothetical protein